MASPQKTSYTISIWIILLLYFWGLPQKSMAQFFNGHQMSFGKNRVQHREFLWQFYRFDKFDTYFYVNGRELAELTAEIAHEEIPILENFFQYNLEKRIIFLVYNKLADFRQSNIGLISDDSERNIGGVTQIVNNKVFLYFEGDREKFREQIKGTISEVIMNEMLYGSSFRERLANSTLLSIPEWYLSGLKSYLSTDWNFEIENRVRDGVSSGLFEKFNHLKGENASFAGHSIWAFIAEQYGRSTIPNIVYLTRIHKNAEQGFLYVLGIDFDDLTREWLYYLKKRYDLENEIRTIPIEEPVHIRSKKNTRITQAKRSSDGEHLAWVTNKRGKYKIFVQHIESGKKKKIFQKEHSLEQITDYSYPILAWHPSNEIIAFISLIQGKNILHLYNLTDKKLDEIQLFNFEKILSFSYSHDGMRLVMSATTKGQSDIYIHSLTSHTQQAITNDFADDFNPIFINNSKQILFSSNRKNTDISAELGPNIEINPTKDIFIYDISKKEKELIRITDTPFADDDYPYLIDKNTYTYISNKDGIYNQYKAYYDSAIAFVDTITHYRYFSRFEPLSRYNRNIDFFDLTYKDEASKIFFYENRNHLILSTIDFRQKGIETTEETYYKKSFVNRIQVQDSIKRNRLTKLEEEIERISEFESKIVHDTLIDIANYIFEIEKPNSPKRKDFLLRQKEKLNLSIPRSRIYQTAFYTDYMVNQIDFTFLNAAYQQFTGGAVYYNPGFNFFFKTGVNELFEDYRLTGGVRFSTDFQSNEYLISMENLKKRLDEQYIFHRQTFQEIGNQTARKNFTHQMMYIRTYPFSQVAALKGTLTLRHDQQVILSTDNSTARRSDIQKAWSGFRLEYIFDNTTPLVLNINSGTRFKVFSEAYWEIDGTPSDLYVLGADFRFYQPIHREIIWASRIAASTNFGRSRLIYYLGSVDNWMSFLSSQDVFDRSVAIDQSQNFVYQTLATNMRGFTQNIRNGNSFFLLNNEIRFPFVRYFVRKPLSSEFFSNMQLVGFFDFGTAWSGDSPFSTDNAYNYIVTSNGPVTVVLNKDHNPFVYGYGWGLRTKLFGYFIRADWAWGVEDRIIQPRIFYISLSLDF